jgi:SagB-type dehydrogenase family enzyme
MEKYRRSPFLFIYWDEEGKFVLYNYNRHTKAIVSKDIIRILEILSNWRSKEQIFVELGIDRKSLTHVLKLLVTLKLIDKKPVDSRDLNLIKNNQWGAIDLAMQRQRSYGGRIPIPLRVGRSPNPLKRVKGISSIKLPIPNNSSNVNQKYFLEVLEKRKTVRSYSKRYMDLTSLSTFLYNAARIKGFIGSNGIKLTDRPYPSGGARYPLEIYVANNKIHGIDKGIHYYDPLKHRLVFLKPRTYHQKEFNEFLIQIQKPLMKREADVVLIITAVFARTMWKYEKLGMSLIMSDLGCLYQTLYLVATEMKLAPCPLGKTNESLIADWLDLDWFEESHVGTFMLGNA